MRILALAIFAIGTVSVGPQRRPRDTIQGVPLGTSFVRSSSSSLISPSRGFFRGGGMKSIGQAHRTETEIATSTLPRIAFEYGQMA